MHPRLVFLHIDKYKEVFKNISINFSNNLEIKFIDYKLSISNMPPYRFFEGNILDVNLLIGRNGSGKTTIMNLIGELRQDRKMREDYLENSWFLVYQLGNKYVIEGVNKNLILNLNNQNGTYLDDEYGVVCNYIKDELFIEQYIQNEMDKIKYLYFTMNHDKTWVRSSPQKEEDDHNFGFERNYIVKPKLSSICTLLTKQRNIFSNQIDVDKLEVMISFKDRLYHEFLDKRDKSKLMEMIRRILSFREYENFSEENTRTDQLTLFLIRLYKYILVDMVDTMKYVIQDEKKIESYLEIEEFISKYDAITNFHIIENSEYHLSEFESLLFDFSTILKSLKVNYKLEEKTSFIEHLKEILLSKRNKNKFRYTDRDETLIFNIGGLTSKQVVKIIDGFEDFYIVGNKYNPFRIHFSQMSKGEIEFINVFGNIYTHLDKINDTNKTIILLLDEPDLAFHPEWSRRFIYYLNKLLNIRKFKKIRYQVIITTHSPFMVSDLPANQIHCINYSINPSGAVRSVEKAKFGFMSNIYDIIRSDFFLDSAIGEFASEKFKSIKDIMNKDNIEENQDQINEFIKVIDDEVIRFNLTMALQKRLTQNKIGDLNDKDSISKN